MHGVDNVRGGRGQAKPGEYEKIAREVKRLGVTWEQAMNHWGTRTAIWKTIGYYY